MLLISAHEWKMKKESPQISFVSERDKDVIWDSITAHFHLPGGEDIKKLVKSWALKKMVTQFQTRKKKLYNEFVKKNLTLDFSDNSHTKS
jgi:hypothetical protein